MIAFLSKFSLWTQITKQHNRPNPKSFLNFPAIYNIFPFLFLIVLTVLILKPRLHVGHFYLHTSFECCRDYQSVTRVARVRFCNKIAETMWQNIHRVEHIVDIGHTWLHVQPPSTSVAEQLRRCQSCQRE